MDWQRQGGKNSVCLPSRDSADCAKLSSLDVVPSCPVTVCVQCGPDKPFPEAAEASTAPTVPAGTATNGAPGARHPLIRWRWDSCGWRGCQAGPPQHCPAQLGWTGLPAPAHPLGSPWVLPALPAHTAALQRQGKHPTPAAADLPPDPGR